MKLDENLGRRAADLLRGFGHEVVTVPEQDLCSAEDKKLLEICQREAGILVTLDLEFGNPLLFRPSQFPGIAVLRLPRKPTPDDLTDALQTLAGGVSQEGIKGKLWIVQRGRIRQYQEESA